MPVERASTGRCPGLLAWACDRPEIDPARIVSRHPAGPYVPVHLIQVRRCGTPETPLVRDLVRTHTSPGHENGPQAKLAGR
jgi:hypothetical protein